MSTSDSKKETKTNIDGRSEETQAYDHHLTLSDKYNLDFFWSKRGDRMEFMMSANDVGYMGFGFNGYGRSLGEKKEDSDALPILQPFHPSSEGAIKSAKGDTTTQIIFYNNRAGRVEVFWLDYQGKRVSYGFIEPGAKLQQQTYVTHPWLITDTESKGPLAIFLPDILPARAYLYDII